LRFARYDNGGSESRFPANDGAYSKSDSRDAGDTFLGRNGNAPTDFFGTDHFNTIIHEMGHAFGLKHGHDNELNGALAPQFNDNEFSVMTYASYIGSPIDDLTEARPGSSPQSYMMFDIAALQALYGANYGRVGTTAVYTWDPATGQQRINGVAAPDTGTSATGKIFSTVWTQGATATYDLANLAGDQHDDLRPGGWLAFSFNQLADLNSEAAAGTRQFMARGNVYNALLHDGDTRSLVSNLFTGSGRDTLIGNDLGNDLRANAGNDIIFAGPGNDTISGGPGFDTIDTGSGIDTVRDRLVDLNGDFITGVRAGTTIDITGSLIGRNFLSTVEWAGSTTLAIADYAVAMAGLFADGEFMAVPRSTGTETHTSVMFVNFLPSLFESVSVAADAINGVANEPFLTSDGSTRFSMDMKTAQSTFANTLGVYRVAADGTIHDTQAIYANTRGVFPSLSTVDLGTPANGERLAFFLIQDGFGQYGDLPDDLRLVAPGTTTAANVNAGVPPELLSASLGRLTAAPIFHTIATLNPGDAVQVLSGTAAGGRELLIGFEDLPTASGDRDFQDVVIGLRTNYDDLFVI